MSKKSAFIIIGIAILIIIIDQVTKQMIKTYLLDTGIMQVNLLGDFLKFTYVENSGIAFGIKIWGGQVSVLILIFTAIIGISYYFYKIRKNHLAYQVCFGLILGGAFGNLIDRIIYGKVTDFIHFDVYRGYVWDIYVSALPIFNFADVAITTAVIIIFLKQNEIFSISNEATTEPVDVDENTLASEAQSVDSSNKES